MADTLTPVNSGTIVGGNTNVLNIQGPLGNSLGLFNTFYASGGTWNGGNLKLQASPDGGTTWVDIPNATLSADGMFNFNVKATKYRVVATTVTSVPWWVC